MIMRLRGPAVSLLLAALLLAGCQPAVYLMPTPVAMRSGELDPFQGNPQLKRSNRIQVVYATNRLPDGPPSDRVYTRDYDSTLRFGQATLVIGPQDSLWDRLYAESTTRERKRDWRIRLEKAEEAATLTPDDPLDRLPPPLQRFFADLNRRIDASLHGDLTVYVHGANNNFYRASAQAAQYRHFTGYNSVVLVFAWPSAESLLRYGTDVENAAATAPVFARMLDLLARHSTARYINVIAYSAGAMVASPGLATLRGTYAQLRPRELHRRLRLGEIYFAAPDVDLKTFVSDLAIYGDAACNVTITVNLNDSVLGLAEAHHGRSRAGRPDLAELGREETRWLVELARSDRFDVIDVNSQMIPDLSTGSHSFWYSHPWVSSDVLTQFLYHTNPANRGLVHRTQDPDDPTWYFPSDYPERVVKAVKRLDAMEDYHLCRDDRIPPPRPGVGNSRDAGSAAPDR